MPMKGDHLTMMAPLRISATRLDEFRAENESRGACALLHPFERPSRILSMTFDYLRRALAVLSTTILCGLAANADDKTTKVRSVAVAAGCRPVVAKTDSGGTIHVLSDSQNGPKYAKSVDAGSTFSAPIPVVSGRPQTAQLEFSAWDMALGKGGRVHVAMSTNAWKLKLPEEEWGYFYANLDPSSTAFSPVQNINRRPSEGFSLAADNNGRVTACWLADKLYANVSRDNGKTFAPFVELNSRYNPCNCCTTSTVYAEDGRLAVLYREETNNERDMYLALVDQEGQRMTRNRVSRTLWKIDACPMTYYTISRNGGGFVTVWPTAGQIYFARLDGRGNPLAPGEIKTPGRSGMRTGMLALSAPDGSTLVAWKTGDRLEWQLYGGDGRPSGEPGSAASQGNGAAGVVSKDGRFILFR
jgi:hypothetical protein